MSKDKIHNISKMELEKLDEKDLMFITNPGRMGDEDGITFVIKNNNEYTIYRVNGLIYGSMDKDSITFEDIKKQFPKWFDTWKNCHNKEYKGKYKHLYMGFGNGLNVDNSIYNVFKPYLDEMIKKNLEKYSEQDKKDMQYAVIYSIWQEAFINMVNENGYILKL